MLLCDFQLFWLQHSLRPSIDEVLASCQTEREYYDICSFFGFKIQKPKLRRKKKK